MSPPLNTHVRVMLVDAYATVRVAIRQMLERNAGLKIVAEAATLVDAIAQCGDMLPDIVLLEPALHGESSLAVIREAQAQLPKAHIILFTYLQDADLHFQAVQLGAMGIVLKSDTPEALLKAIHRVCAGEAWISGALTARMLRQVAAGGKDEADVEQADTQAILTDRELQVIGMICEGLQNKAIAQRMMLSEFTVRHHLTSIFKKLGVENRLELVIYAYRHGLAAVTT